MCVWIHSGSPSICVGVLLLIIRIVYLLLLLLAMLILRVILARVMSATTFMAFLCEIFLMLESLLSLLLEGFFLLFVFQVVIFFYLFEYLVRMWQRRTLLTWLLRRHLNLLLFDLFNRLLLILLDFRHLFLLKVEFLGSDVLLHKWLHLGEYHPHHRILVCRTHYAKLAGQDLRDTEGAQVAIGVEIVSCTS